VDSCSTEQVALLSIHPRYANALLNGEKRIEFRRTRPRQDLSLVVIYATRPVGKVIGWFEVDDVIEAAPRTLWRRFGTCAGIDRASYFEYYKEASRAFGITVRRAVRLDEPRDLEELQSGLRPPQSYQYLRSETLATLVT
jgi:predicted transcriptional regulator